MQNTNYLKKQRGLYKMIIENLIEIAKINNNITRLKTHKFTQEEQKGIDKFVEEANKKINIDNFIKEAKNIFGESSQKWKK